MLEQVFSLIDLKSYELFLFDYKKKEELFCTSNPDHIHLKQTYNFLYDQDIIAILKHDKDLFVEEKEAIELIQSIVTIMYLENVKKIRLDQELLKKDLEIAAKMQGLLIPKELFNNEYFHAAGLYKPNYLIGGDYYDVISINENKIAFCIADISGKGVNAAILMANFQAILRSILVREFAVEQAIDILNHKVFDITKGEKFITLFLGIYNFESGRLVYANCGHNPIALYSKDSFEWLEKGTTILGVFESLPFIEVGKLYIKSDMKLLLYTDGILNLKNNQNQALSLYDLRDILQRELIASTPEDIIEHFDTKINQINVEDSLKDDVSLLAIDIKEPI